MADRPLPSRIQLARAAGDAEYLAFERRIKWTLSHQQGCGLCAPLLALQDMEYQDAVKMLYRLMVDYQQEKLATLLFRELALGLPMLRDSCCAARARAVKNSPENSPENPLTTDW